MSRAWIVSVFLVVASLRADTVLHRVDPQLPRKLSLDLAETLVLEHNPA